MWFKMFHCDFTFQGINLFCDCPVYFQILFCFSAHARPLRVSMVLATHTSLVPSEFPLLMQSQTPLESFISPGWFPFLFKVPAGGKLPCCFLVPGDQAFLFCFTIQWAREEQLPCVLLPCSGRAVSLSHRSTSWSLCTPEFHGASHTGVQEHDLFCTDLRAECWNEGKVKPVHAALSLQTQEGGLCWQWASTVTRPQHCRAYGQLEAALRGPACASRLFSGDPAEGWSHAGWVPADKASALCPHRSPITH